MLDVDELRTKGFTVVRGFADRDACRAARLAIDAFWGAAAEVCDVRAELLGHNSSNANFTHVVSHPSSILRMAVPFMPALADVHAASLDSDLGNVRLNGQHFIRTDPDESGNQSQSIPITPDQSQSIPITPNYPQFIPITPNQSRSIPINPPINPNQSQSIPINPNYSQSIPINPN
eukprot:SAG31_NODE_7105_length_1787_cov_1.252962_1_plen_176_part_00